ncbi:hypothetical protein [Rhodococcus erythropolis]|uniref:hypothetical protein n=1 Tax=Rhodococcus erythropolis TaxID=1833 RepID=UPI00367308B8
MDYNPWRDARDNFADYLIDRSRELPAGLKGCVKGKTIYICRTLNQFSRRTTLSHELTHIVRGTNHVLYLSQPREELAIDKLVARQFIHIDKFIAAVPFGGKSVPAAIADDLQVDQHTLRTWVHNLTDREREYIEIRLQERDHP